MLTFVKSCLNFKLTNRYIFTAQYHPTSVAASTCTQGCNGLLESIQAGNTFLYTWLIIRRIKNLSIRRYIQLFSHYLDSGWQDMCLTKPSFMYCGEEAWSWVKLSFFLLFEKTHRVLQLPWCHFNVNIWISRSCMKTYSSTLIYDRCPTFCKDKIKTAQYSKWYWYIYSRNSVVRRRVFFLADATSSTLNQTKIPVTN